MSQNIDNNANSSYNSSVSSKIDIDSIFCNNRTDSSNNVVVRI